MSLRKQAFSGTIWTAISSGIMAFIQILRLSILTRFLEKSDFGLIAIVLLVLGFTQIFADLGVSVSLFSRKEITKKEYSSLYWVSIILGFLLYLILVAASPFIAAFYEQPLLNKLIPIMGLDLIIATAGVQFRIFRQKALLFKNLAIIDIVSTLLSLIVAIILAYKGAGVWSIVYSTLFASLLANILLIVTGLRKHPLIFYINIKEGRAFYRIGFYQTGAQILDYLASQLDILIIGKVMNFSELGAYNLVKQLVSKVYAIVNPIITKVAIPVLATMNDNLNLLKAKYLQMLELVSFVNFAIYGLMAVLAKEVLIIMYGVDYIDSTFIFQILCIWGVLNAVTSVASTIIVIKGRTDLGFRWTVLRIITNPIFVIVGSYWGLTGIVIGQMGFSLIFFSVYWKFVVNRTLGNLPFNSYARTTFPKLATTLIIFLLLLVFRNFILQQYNNVFLNLGILGFIFMISFLIINKKDAKDMIAFVRKKES